MKQPRYRKLTSEAALRRIGESFCAGTISRCDWTHQAHVAAAVYLIALRPDIALEREMPRLIRELNTSHGTENTPSSGYHHTITLAFLAALRVFVREHDDVPPFQIVNLAMASPLGSLDWMLDCWSKELLFSSRARLEWVEPDKPGWHASLAIFGNDRSGGAGFQ